MTTTDLESAAATLTAYLQETREYYGDIHRQAVLTWAMGARPQRELMESLRQVETLLRVLEEALVLNAAWRNGERLQELPSAAL